MTEGKQGQEEVAQVDISMFQGRDDGVLDQNMVMIQNSWIMGGF